MPPENLKLGGGLSETLLHPAVLTAMVVTIVLILLLRRKYVILPLLFATFLTPSGQELYVAGVHVSALRILILAGWVRIVWTKLRSKTDLVPAGFNSLDKAFALWAIFRASAFMLLYQQKEAVINQCGFLWDAFGAYFILRFFIQGGEDIKRVLKVLATITVILAITMLDEKLRSQNLFGLLGGVPSVPGIRSGSIRAQGPFAHPILAGTFGATLLPLFLWLRKSGKSGFLAIVGMIALTVITLTSASSTPILAYGAGILAISFWPLRKQMRLFRWGIVIALVALHLVMKAPVWFLINRVNVVDGSSGYHRAMLVDQFIRHFGDWWLLGTDANQNWGFDMWDLSNQFVAEGETGGLATLVCFIAIIVIGFCKIGIAREVVEGDRRKEWFLWCLGAALIAHIVGFFGISYFDQTRVSWFVLLAMISAGTASIRAARSVPEHQTDMASANLRLAYPSASRSGSARSCLRD